MRPSVLIAAALALAFAPLAHPQDPPAKPPGPTVLETVVVSGVQPGPGLWRVSKDGHQMWILGTLSPLPKRMTWESGEVWRKIKSSGEVVMPAGAELTVDGGPLRGLFLIPSLLKARNNPGKQPLKDVVPPDLYARWLALKQEYRVTDASIEKRRPILAGFELYEKAIKRSGMSFKDIVTKVVDKAARFHDVPITRPKVTVKIEEPKAAVKGLQKTSLDDLECFRLTLTRLERDVETMKLRGNAWATGDVESLRELPFTDRTRACVDAILDNALAAEHGLADLGDRVDAAWLEAAEAAIAKHETSFAMLPISEILDADGYVETLRAKGYTVESP